MDPKTDSEKESQAQFKVVDRRRFTEEGELREEEIEAQTPKEPVDSAKGLHPESKLEDYKEQTESEQSKRGPITFSIFVQSLAHQALMGLGVLPWPDSGLVQVKLELAKETINVITLLKEKTLGNLNTDEQKLLDGLLYQLRMAFVDVTQNPNPK